MGIGYDFTSAAGRTLDGYIDDLMIYSRALDIGEIVDIKNNSPGKH